MRRLSGVFSLAGLVAALCPPGAVLASDPALAQSTNARPDLYRSDRPFEVDKLSVLPESALAAVRAAIADVKSGDSQGFVFVASPGMNFWRLTGAPKGVTTLDRADMARTTLEVLRICLRPPLRDPVDRWLRHASGQR